MTFDTSLPLVNFARESGWNPVEAWLLGVEPVITGHTDNANALATVLTFQQAFQNPKFCADKTGKVVPCNSPDRVQGGATGGNNNPIYGENPQSPQSLPPDNSGDWHKETIWTDKDGNEVPANTPGATPNEMWVRGAGITDAITSNADNWFKRIALLLIALVVIAVAIASLR